MPMPTLAPVESPPGLGGAVGSAGAVEDDVAASADVGMEEVGEDVEVEDIVEDLRRKVPDCQFILQVRHSRSRRAYRVFSVD